MKYEGWTGEGAKLEKEWSKGIDEDKLLKAVEKRKRWERKYCESQLSRS